MPSEASKSEQTQPWRQWYSALMASTPKDKTIVMEDDVDAGMNPAKYGMSQHGTIALDPRTDVDFAKKKVKPVRASNDDDVDPSPDRE
ncbi:hypothetical protein BOTCAL_0391g00020 [Botryotinia calthae]|uniref:Uncharacterized protein n=1 Tax=Botryotinia calthae TaxID=38488 RepID=A0A4Y8CTJ9_9HELO|nr:hypothetical protein BOTCAL_0391g00020 [Botryotinia calthae]